MGLLDGKVVIVTGVGPGLGRQVALAAAVEGAAVVLAARTEAFLDEVAAGITDKGGRALAVPTNIVDPEQCQRLVDRTVDGFGHVDCLVNSAFRPDVFKRFDEVDLKVWRKLFEVNTFGALQLAQAVVPPMKAQGGGSIVFVGSMVVRKPMELQGGYAASKAALMSAAQTMAKELGPHRIRVNTVLPGWMWGHLVKVGFEMNEAGGGPSVQQQYDDVTANIPLGEMPTDEEVAKAILFFASDLSKAVTGQTLDVNGGEVFA